MYSKEYRPPLRFPQNCAITPMRLAMAMVASLVCSPGHAASAQSALKTSAFESVIASCDGRSGCEGNWQGLKYEFYSSSAVYIETSSATWEILCRVDDMDDSRSCSLSTLPKPNATPNDPRLLILWTSYSNSAAITLISKSKRYPGSPQMLRIDQHTAWSTFDTFGGKASAIIINQMKSGRILKMRYSDWPDNIDQDGDLDITDAGLILQAAAAVRHTNGVR
jgi:hypothetical protein